MDDRRRRRRRWVVPAVATLLSVAVAAGCTGGGSDQSEPDAGEPPLVTETANRSAPPSVGGTRLAILDEASRPPEPTQWGTAGEPVPFGQWWSGLATGPGIPALWAQPLLLRMGDDGRADLSAPTYASRPDGFRDADVVPAVFFEFGPDAAVQVIDHGPLHVRFVVSGSGGGNRDGGGGDSEGDITITMVQGSPFLEFEGSGTLSLTVPSLRGLAAAGDGPAVERFSTAAGTWLLASSDAADLDVEGDLVTLRLTPGTRHAIGPVPDDATNVDDAARDAAARYDAAALAVATEPLGGTSEQLTVASDGTVRQVLEQHRGTGEPVPVAWSLLPHHRDFLAGDVEPAGSLTSVYGTSRIVTATTLTMEYPAVPIVWDTVVPPGFEEAEVAGIDRDDVPDIGIGSYFGAKHTSTNALVYDILRSAGLDETAVPYLEAAEASLGSLVTSGTDPQLRWEPGWGSVVVTPAEFGSGNELNDHQLQNGYWVGAAASVVAADPTQQRLLEEGIDLLVADYAGSVVVPHLAGTVSDEGTWSPFAGHSWASGVGGFAAGNNLESVSESSYAWWAGAKWFLATDRTSLAEPFIARLTIESWVTGYEWLPTAEHQSDDPAIRPWTGVVWAGKADPGTWFDASDEAALGIRLLPVGPQSFSRYPDRDAVQAAEDRWAWCEDRGDGCVERWSNLLDADAAVAGRPRLPAGDLPEESTTELVRGWWRANWEGVTIADGWSCTPGTTIRRLDDGSLVALVTNPSSEPLAVTCRHGEHAPFDVVAEPRSAVVIPVG